MQHDHILRVVRATRVGEPSAVWPCAWCGSDESVAVGWIVDHEDEVPGQSVRAFVCDRCARDAKRRARAWRTRGRLTCSRCGRECPEGEGAVIGRVDDVAPDQVCHVPVCIACVEAELADDQTEGGGPAGR